MKFKIFFLGALFIFVSGDLAAQTKHALIVAIGNYPNPRVNKWKPINSANDVPLIKDALVNSQQFSEHNIDVLIDAQATKQGIIDAMDKLYKKINKGDIVVIHFSSHGQQLEDDNDDEVDGLDEAIVPYGAVFSTDPEKFDAVAPGYLRDDVFGDKINLIRNKLGKDGDVLVNIDACHSGSATRGNQIALVRGGNGAMVSSNFNSRRFSGADTAGVFKENRGTRLSADAASMVLISGAQARELNSECFDDNDKPVGSLSYAFSKAISSLKGNITYRGFFALIEDIMQVKAPLQKPVLEGDAIDRELFGGKFVKQQTYFAIDPAASNADKIFLKAGFVSGITRGSVINFYELGTTSTAGKEPIGKGKVETVSSFSATVQLDKPDAGLAKKNPWAFISELGYGAEKIKLTVNNNTAIEKLLRDSLKNYQRVEFKNNFDLYLDTSGSVNNWALKYPNSGAVFQDGFNFSPRSDMTDLKNALNRFDRFRYLKGLSFNEDGLSARVELVFLDSEGKIDSATLKSRMHLGRLELREGDKVNLKITNTGNRNFYFNIVDIQPDGFINAIMPNKGVRNRNGNPDPVRWEDCQVAAFDSFLVTRYVIRIAKPYGEETFKVFLSASPLDLEDILTSNNEKEAVGKRGGVLNGLEKIFVNSKVNEVGKRGGETESVNTDQNGTIFSVNFTIAKK